MQVPNLMLSFLQRSVNSLLTIDEGTRTGLHKLNGRRITVHVTDIDLLVLVHINQGYIQLSQVSGLDGEGFDAPSSDTTISGNLFALSSLLAGSQDRTKDEIAIDGDLSVAQRLKAILANLDPDWQEALSPILGDTLVHRLDRGSSGFASWLNRTKRSLADNTSEFLQEEAEMIAANGQIRGFCEDVDRLKSQADRLDARVRLLEQIDEASEATEKQD